MTNHQKSKNIHIFHEGNPVAEKKILIAVILTFIVMIVEIVSGWLFNSMALLADGWHMSTHAFALGLSIFAYVAARKFSQHSRFNFGTWKIEILASYTSALFLVGVAIIMAYESLIRLINPAAIQYNEAIGVAILGLLVNLICAWLLREKHDHHHGEHHHHDLNLRSAYIHVITDAATSVLAIIALLAGKWWGASWLDPVMGIVGAILISVWAYGLLRDSSFILLDAEMGMPLAQEIEQTIENNTAQTTIDDLHLWRVSKDKYACIISITTKQPMTPEYIKSLLKLYPELAHITVEINH